MPMNVDRERERVAKRMWGYTANDAGIVAEILCDLFERLPEALTAGGGNSGQAPEDTDDTGAGRTVSDPGAASAAAEGGDTPPLAEAVRAVREVIAELDDCDCEGWSWDLRQALHYLAAHSANLRSARALLADAREWLDPDPDPEDAEQALECVEEALLLIDAPEADVVHTPATPKPTNPPPWACPACTWNNRWDAVRCRGCNALRPNGLGEWTCPSCEFANHLRRPMCRNCGHDRPFGVPDDGPE